MKTLIQKFLLGAGTMMASTTPTMQAACATLVLLVALVVQALVKPYRFEQDNLLEFVSLLQPLFLLPPGACQGPGSDI